MTWQCPRCKVEFREPVPGAQMAETMRCDEPACHVRYVDGWAGRGNKIRMYLVSKTSPHMSEDYL